MKIYQYRASYNYGWKSLEIQFTNFVCIGFKLNHSKVTAEYITEPSGLPIDEIILYRKIFQKLQSQRYEKRVATLIYNLLKKQY